MKNFLFLNLFLFFSVCLVGCGTKGHQVQFSSEPSGAKIFYQDSLIGETPIQTIINPQLGDFNVYIFRAEKDEYIPNQQFFKEEFYNNGVADAVPPKIHFLMDKRKKYPIHITSAPDGATLIFNGKVIGKTPITVTVLEHIGTVRKFEFTAKKKGFKNRHKVLKEFIAEESDLPFEFPESIHFEF